MIFLTTAVYSLLGISRKMPFLLQLWDTPPSVLLPCICAGVLLAIGLRKVYLWSRLRHIPGPRLAAWSSGWQVAGVLSGQYHEWLKEAIDEHGASGLPAPHSQRGRRNGDLSSLSPASWIIT